MTKNTEKCGEKLAASNGVTARMNKDLRDAYDEIKTLVVAADLHDVHARYEIASHCQMVRAGDGKGSKYGYRAVTTLANALGWSKSNVHDYANVAESWPDKQTFDVVAERKDKDGKPFSWYHIVLLAKADAARRDKLVEDAIEHGWNVRELRKKLPTGTAEGDDAMPTAAPQPDVPRVLANAIGTYARRVATLKTNVATFDEQIKQAAPADLTDAVVDQLTKARQDLSDLLRQLNKYIDQVQNRRSSPPPPQHECEDAVADPPQDQSHDEHEDQAEEALVGAV